MTCPEGARRDIRAVLACARRATGTGTAAFVPLCDDLEPEVDGQGLAESGALLETGDRGALCAGRPLRGASPLGARLFVPVPSPAGVALGGLGIFRPQAADEGPRDEQALRELAGLLGHALAAQTLPEQDELARFFALSYDNLCIAGFDGYFKLLNPRWSETLGYPLEDLYSRPYLDFVHPEDRARTVDEAEAIRGGEKTITFSNRYLTRSGAICHFQWTAVPALDRRRIYAVARDVTEQMRVEAELLRSHGAAEAASQAKSAFLAMMSHELRTPLNSVIGFANLLLRNERGVLGADELGYVARIQRNGEALLVLINSILDLSRIEAGRVEPLLADANLTALAREVVESLRPQAPSGVQLLMDVPAEPITLRTDEGRLRHILFNLVGNGLKFTPKGAVTLRLARKPLRFEVEDSGPGIPPEHLGTIFEPFRQLEEGAGRRHGGTGLGLAISRSFADALGLAIEVESSVGRGTLFRVVLERSA